MDKKRDWAVFWCSFFFVLGFSTIFSLLGVLLQGVLSTISYDVQVWLSRIGGVVIMLFGISLLGLLHLPFLEKEHKFKIHKLKSSYLSSFVFGAAFAVGWTPCVGPVLGAVLTLAVTQPAISFFLLLVYSLGLGIPFLLVGLFTNQAKSLIRKGGKWLRYVNYVFGIVLIAIGALVFTRQLERLASFEIITSFLLWLNASGPSGQSLSMGIAFIAGLVSFLSPCVLPLIPGFFAYLASVMVKE